MIFLVASLLLAIAAILLAILCAYVYYITVRAADDLFQGLPGDEDMAKPTIEQLLAALEALREALAAEQAAHAISQQRAREFLDLLAAYNGGVTPADLAELQAHLEAHAEQLEQIKAAATK